MSKNIYLFSFWAIIGILTLPSLMMNAEIALDPSWQIALYIAAKNTLQFGRDFVFTYGPLGFLMFPMFIYDDLWALSFFFHIIVHFIFIFFTAYSLNKFKADFRHYAVISVSLFAVLPFYPDYMDYKVIYIATISLYLALTFEYSKRKCLLLIVISTVQLAIVSLIKFSSFIISLSLILSVVILLTHKRNFVKILSILFFYTLLLLFFWILSGQNISNIPAYISTSLEISAGYVKAMGNDKRPVYEILVGLATLLFVFFLFIKASLEKRYKLFLFIFLNIGLIFFSFKHGFVRHDTYHFFIFFITSIYFFGFLYIFNRDELGDISRKFILFFLAASIVILNMNPSHTANPMHNLSLIKKYISVFISKEYRDEIRAEEKKIMRKKFALLPNAPSESTIQAVNGRSVAILAWQISLAYAYDLNLKLRPVPQSYSAYTSRLDNLNSDFFKSNKAPEVVLYTPAILDERSPLFDEPATLRTLLENYKPLFRDSYFIFLEKRKEKIKVTELSVLTKTIGMGGSAEIPEVNEGEILFAKIYMDYSKLGKIVGFLYKPPNTKIQFIENDGKVTPENRFIHSNADNGIVLSPCVYNLNDLFNLWRGSSKKNNIRKKMIISSKNNYLYGNDIKIKFIKVTLNSAQFSIAEFEKNVKKS